MDLHLKDLRVALYQLLKAGALPRLVVCMMAELMDFSVKIFMSRRGQGRSISLLFRKIIDQKYEVQ